MERIAMKQTLEKMTTVKSALMRLIFRTAAQQRADAHNKLSRHIVALNKKSSSTEIINEVADCLKEILGYRLFAFVVRKDAGMDVWLDPRMYKNALEDTIIKDFPTLSRADLTYLNHTFEPEEHHEPLDLDNLVHYDLAEDNCQARLYMMPEKGITRFHDEVVHLILQSSAAALSKQIQMENLRHAAVLDPLTGCYNRREFETQLRRHAATAARHNSRLSVFMLDLDHFKSINDTHGHLCGDQVLREVSRLVRNSMRQGDILARYGGEEFIAILPETDRAKAMELANRLRIKISHLRIPFNQTPIQVTASFGVAELIPNADISRVIDDADTMLYKAKRNGRNTVMPGLIKVCPPREAQDLRDEALN
jgi:diguanylate cyclase (GGDEF)-like protein